MPVAVDIFPLERVEDVQVRLKHVLGDGRVDCLITVVQRNAKPVFRQIRQCLVDSQRGKDECIADFVVRGVPLATQVFRIHTEAAGTEGKVVFQHLVGFV